ncbi:uncharacterized protein LOC141826197 isoform X2 [Curcuma longa]|uniref:uncharacterized protein LOC141826197 isoform X2 n=1 Tax=Curcuma longa TaxID=136217 RepID=UPI003D9E36D4
MASGEQLSLSSSGGKHQRSSDDHGAEASSKRRKHHHRRRHRHRSKQGREIGEDARATSPADQAVACSSVAPMPVDDELEEGEILEEDEHRPEINGESVEGFKLGGGSDVEAADINSSGVDGDTNQILHASSDTTCTQSMKVFAHNQGVPKTDISIRSGRAIYDEDTLALKIENVPLIIMEKDITFKEEAKQRQLKSSENDVNDAKVCVTSKSPVSREHSHSINPGKEDDFGKRYSDNDSEMLDSRDHMDSRDTCGRHSDSNKCIPSERLSNKYHEIGRSPSSKGFHDKAWHRDRSRSCDHTERPSYEKVLQPLANDDDLVDSERGSRDDSERYNMFNNDVAINRASIRELQNERESSITRIQDDRHGNRDKDRERERNSRGSRDRGNGDLDKRTCREREQIGSHNRHDAREYRHGNHGIDKERERIRGSIKNKDNNELQKEVRPERESSRYSRNEKNHDARDKDRNRERYSSSRIERARDSHSDLKRERNQDSRYERDIVNDHRHKNPSLDKEVNVHKDRNHEQIEKDRGTNWDKHMESRHTRRDEVQHHKDKSRSKEADFHIDQPNEDKQKFTREEEEDYQERIEQQLAKQDEEDVDKIKEESRKRRQAILEKYRQRQLQQVESSCDGNVNAIDKAILDKKQQSLQATVPVDKPNDHELENANDFGDTSDVDTSFTVKKSLLQIVNSADKALNTAGGLGEGTPKSERSADMFSDDIFGESPSGVSKMVKDEGPQIDRSCLNDNWDDAEGYYTSFFRLQVWGSA